MPRHDEVAPIAEALGLSQRFIEDEAQNALWEMGIATKPYPSQREILGSHAKILAYFGANRCLALETAVTMGDGDLKLLRDIEVGDEVMAFDFTMDRFVPAKVLEVYENGPRHTWRWKWSIGSDSWHVDCTRSHKVCIQHHGNCKYDMVRVGRAAKKGYPVVVTTPGGGTALASLHQEGEDLGFQETRDLLIDHPDHAFLANGLVVSNSGKTHTSMVKCAWDATGIYPDWYDGPRTARGIDAWVMGDTGSNTRDTAQRKLFGPNSERPGWTDKPFKEALISEKYIIGRPSKQSAPPGLFDTVRVRHVPSNTTSLITFKSHKMNRQALASWHGARVYIDEEPDLDILMEMIARVADDRGQIFVSLCPLDGMTPTVKFLLTMAESDPNLVKVCYLAHSEAEHLAPEEKAAMAKLYASNPAMLIARTEGRVVMNHGLIFPFPLQDLLYDPNRISIAKQWPALGGADVGWRHPWGASLGFHDPLSDTIYVHATYEKAEQPYGYHHAQLNAWGENLTFMIDPAARQANQATGVKILEELWKLAHPGSYRDDGVMRYNYEDIPEEKRKYIKADNTFQTGMDDMWNRFNTKRLLFNMNLRTLHEQYESYAWNKDGSGPKEETENLKYDVITSVRYLVRGVQSGYAHSLFEAPWREADEFESPVEVKEWTPYRAGRDR
jgi:phage terminase large subunit-like protein